MKELRNITRETFPKSEKTAEGMIELIPVVDNYEMNYIRDISYIKRGERELFIQLLLPDAVSEKTPLIVYVTGSAFYWQNIPQTLPRLCLLVNKGFAVASVEYRGVEIAPFPMQISDVKAAVRFLKIHASDYGLSKDNLFLMGDSSGGYTALMAGLTAGIAEFEEDIYTEVDSSVRGIVDFYGPTDVSAMHKEPSLCEHTSDHCPEALLIGGRSVIDCLEITAPTNPINYISKDRHIPPVLIFHGTNDEVVPFGQSCLLSDKLRVCGKKSAFYAVEGAHHGGREFWSEQALNIVVEFVREN